MGYVALRPGGLKFAVYDKSNQPTDKVKVYQPGDPIPDQEIMRLKPSALVAMLNLRVIEWKSTKDGEVPVHMSHRNVVNIRDYIKGGTDKAQLNAEILAGDRNKEDARKLERFSRHPVQGTSKRPSSGAPELTHSSTGGPGEATPSVHLIPCIGCPEQFKSRAGMLSHARKRHPAVLKASEEGAAEPQQAG
jgi:hypothetical protein